MRVELINYTQPSLELKLKGIESLAEQIAYVARVSNPGNQANTETAPKLLAYLLKNKHFSPFEMVNVCMGIETTRDIARQILRHRSFSFQEFSQRYAEVDGQAEFREARLQDPKNRQSSQPNKDPEIEHMWEYYQREVAKMTDRAYSWALKNGIAKEQARIVLPEGMTPSRLYMNGTVRSWIHYVELRSSNGTQKEHQEIAIACGAILEGLGICINT